MTRLIPTKGSILLLVLVFGSVFLILLTSLVSFVLIENRAQDYTRAHTAAFSIAEAGLNQYAWRLAHFPNDFTNGTGGAGPYVTTYQDGDGITRGTYTLSIAGNSGCGSTQSVDLSSTGIPSDMTSVSSTVTARYAAPSVAARATIVNNGSNFSAIASNFVELKDAAISSGIYLPRYSTSDGATPNPHLGYHLIFASDGMITIKRVDAVTPLPTVQLADGTSGFKSDFTKINQESSYQTLSVLESCGLIFVEDNVWIEGTVPSKVTVVAANASDPSIAPDIIIQDNITYDAANGAAGITAIAAHSILIAPTAPSNIALQGIFVAQTGVFGRNNYYYPSGGCNGVYEPRETLTVSGSLVSYLPIKTRWTNGCRDGTDAGYQTLVTAVDPANATNPPPFTPVTSTTHQFVTWEQTH